MTEPHQDSVEQLKRHYELEKKLADSLKTASKEQRKYLYKSVYDELFKSIPSARAVAQKSASLKRTKPSPQIRWIKRLLTPDTVFIDVGAGNCSFAFEVSPYVKKVYAIEASKEIATCETYPPNLELIISDTSIINIPDHTADIVYSHHLIEHLHPDDALEHLQNSYRVLVPGGVYACITPNRIFGPHDISKYFDTVATCLHLKEYSIAELSGIFKTTGFLTIKFQMRIFGIIISLPLMPIKWCESLLAKLPRSLRQLISKLFLFKSLVSIRLLARK